MDKILFRFTGYRSPRLPLMVEASRAGQYTAPATHALASYHQSAFDLDSREQVIAARFLADLLTAHPCAHAIIGEHHLSIPHVVHVLRCYEKSFQVSDARAYCWKLHTLLEDRSKVISYPVNALLFSCSPPQTPEPQPGPRTWYFPCRLAVGLAADISLAHPASLRSQVEAVLADSQASWCPRIRHLDQWDLEQWGKLHGEEG